MPVRLLVTSAALAAGLVLAGCNGEGFGPAAKANKPIPEKLLAEIESRNMDKASPMLVRVFKQEAELEVWKTDRSGRFALLKTYAICRWSGDLGPKVKEGDRQAPEGFYSISPAQMNPQSAYYLSFNTGYPNAYDKAWGRTGSQLMVHGDCSSRGCYAMTDEQISEIYALGRESFFGGQNAFQFQAYPFRMTAQNMARHRDNPNMPFWKMIKEGNDHFEVTKLEPKVDFCEKKYVFDAQKPDGQTRPLAFNAAAACPRYEVPAEIGELVAEKQRKDTSKIAELISRGTPLARSRAGVDGGMHPIFATKLPEGGQNAIDRDVREYAIASYGPAPGTIPSTVDPPVLPEQPAQVVAAPPPVETPVRAANASAPNSSAPNSSSPSEGFLSRLSRSVGLRGSEPPPQETVVAPTPVKKPAATAVAQKPKPAPTTSVAKSSFESSKTAEARPSSARVISLDTKHGKSAFPDPAPVASATPPQPIAGAQATVPSGSFDSRWTSFR